MLVGQAMAMLPATASTAPLSGAMSRTCALAINPCLNRLMQGVEDLLHELNAAGEARANPFSLFARRATLVITGLVHISILLLPKSQSDPGADPGAEDGGCSGSAAGPSGAGASGSSSKGSAGPSFPAGSPSFPAGSPSCAPDPAAELRATGFPADSSDLARWERVQGLLERTASGGLSWDNCCVYKARQGAGDVLQVLLALGGGRGGGGGRATRAAGHRSTAAACAIASPHGSLADTRCPA